MNPYILFEGLDLAGKSTTVKNFVGAFMLGAPWEVREKSIISCNPIRDAAANVKKDTRLTDRTAGWFHYASFLADLDVFEAPEHPVVQESVTAFRSIAYHTVLGDRELADKFRQTLARLDIFSDVFLITASVEARQQRLAERRRVSPNTVSFLDELVEQEPRKFEVMEKVMFDAVYEATSKQVHVINTGETSPAQVTDMIVGHLVTPTLFEPTLWAELRPIESSQNAPTQQAALA